MVRVEADGGHAAASGEPVRCSLCSTGRCKPGDWLCKPCFYALVLANRLARSLVAQN